MSAFRETVIKLIGKYRPGLFYYKSDPAARRGISVSSIGDFVDIIHDNDKSIIRIHKNNVVYILDMINSFPYFFGSAQPVAVRRNGHIFHMVDFSTPRLHDVSGFSDFSILCPSLTEPYVTTEQYLEFADLTEGDVVFDLGSYSALTSIGFSKAVGNSGKVLALEPDQMNFGAAERNIEANRRINNLNNIELIPAAVSSEPGFLQFSSEGAMGSALTSIVGKHRGASVQVECVTLQGLVDRYALPKVDFIKMDIEGSELSVIPASGDFLRKYRPKLIIEPHPIRGEMTSVPIVKFLKTLGYTCSEIGQTGLSLPLITAYPPTV